MTRFLCRSVGAVQDTSSGWCHGRLTAELLPSRCWPMRRTVDRIGFEELQQGRGRQLRSASAGEGVIRIRLLRQQTAAVCKPAAAGIFCDRQLMTKASLSDAHNAACGLLRSEHCVSQRCRRGTTACWSKLQRILCTASPFP